MAVSEIPTISFVHGFDVAPTLEDVKDSASCWNNLPESQDQPDASAQHLDEPAELIERHGAQNQFAMHLIHHHDTVGTGEVMVGNNLKTLAGSWTRPMELQYLDLSNMHGHIFKLTREGNLQAYEHREGPPTNQGVAPGFLSELASYLKENKLADIVGLEVIEAKEPLIEFDLRDNSTVMLKPEQANLGKIFERDGLFLLQERGGGVTAQGQYYSRRDS